MIPRTPAAMPTNATRPTRSARRRGQREEARTVHRVRSRMPPLLRRNHLDRGRQRLHVVARLGHRRQARLSVVRHSQRLGGGVEHPVPALELRAVDGEVGLVDQLVRVVAVPRIRGDADRDRRADGLARGLDVEGALGDLLADALRDLERLLRARLREEDAELFAAEARRDVVVAQVRAEDLGDALQHRVPGEMAVRVVDVAQEVEVGHDQRQRPVEALGAHDLLVQGQPEVARVEEAGLRVDACLGLELRDRERAVDQQDRRDRERDQPRVCVPERRDDDAQRGQDELGGETVEGEEPGLADRVPVAEQEHRREHRVVQADEDDRADSAGNREAEVDVRDQAVCMEDPVHRPPRRDRRDHVVADVEELAVPRGPVLQPGRDVLNDRHHDHQLGREEQDRRDQEDVRRVVGLVAGRLDERDLRQRGAPGEEHEGEPGGDAVVGRLEPGAGKAAPPGPPRSRSPPGRPSRTSTAAGHRSGWAPGSPRRRRAPWELRSRVARVRPLVPHVSLS